jgi:hypothetical protein
VCFIVNKVRLELNIRDGVSIIAARLSRHPVCRLRLVRAEEG